MNRNSASAELMYEQTEGFVKQEYRRGHQVRRVGLLVGLAVSHYPILQRSSEATIPPASGGSISSRAATSVA